MNYNYNKSSALNICGKLNLRTGQNAHFNVLTDWDGSCHLTVFMNAAGKKIVVGGSGTVELGRTERYRSSQSMRDLHGGAEFKAIESVPSTVEGLAKLRERHDMSLPFYTYD